MKVQCQKVKKFRWLTFFSVWLRQCRSAVRLNFSAFSTISSEIALACPVWEPYNSRNRFLVETGILNSEKERVNVNETYLIWGTFLDNCTSYYRSINVHSFDIGIISFCICILHFCILMGMYVTNSYQLLYMWQIF